MPEPPVNNPDPPAPVLFEDQKAAAAADAQVAAASMQRGAPPAKTADKLVEHQERTPDESAPPTPPSGESIFRDTDVVLEEQTPATPVAPPQLPQPSFELPKEPPSAAKSKARKALLLPLAAAACVASVGTALVILADHAQTKRHSGGRDGYVDPTEVDRRERAKHELEQLDAERAQHQHDQRDAERHADLPLLPFSLTPTPPAEAEQRQSGDAEQPHEQRRQHGDSAAHEAPRSPAAPAPVIAAASDDPWVRRYGTRVSYNTSASAPESAPPAGRATYVAPIAGTRIQVRANDAIASAPQGPVIAVVETPTRVGPLELPAGTELHGRSAGASGTRILISFTFAIIEGKNVPLKGTALGADGRPGVPGAKSLGGVSDVLAGAAAGGAQALVGIAAAATGNPLAQGLISGAGAPAVGKTSRLNNEEDLVVANAGARFFVYVDSLS